MNLLDPWLYIYKVLYVCEFVIKWHIAPFFLQLEQQMKKKKLKVELNTMLKKKGLGNNNIFCFEDQDLRLPVAFFIYLWWWSACIFQVDCIATTAGGIEEDLMKCMAPSYLGDFSLRGAELRKKGINRIGNLIVPNNNYCKFEEWILPIWDKLLEEQNTQVL